MANHIQYTPENSNLQGTDENGSSYSSDTCKAAFGWYSSGILLLVMVDSHFLGFKNSQMYILITL